MAEAEPIVNSTAREEVRRLVKDYCSTERHPSLSPFRIFGPYSKETLWQTEVNDGPGCYAIYGENGSLIYIGASETGIRSRVPSHFSKSVQQAEFWKGQPSPAKSIDLIFVTQRWEPLSLESYLTIKTKTLRGKPLSSAQSP